MYDKSMCAYDKIRSEKEQDEDEKKRGKEKNDLALPMEYVYADIFMIRSCDMLSLPLSFDVKLSNKIDSKAVDHLPWLEELFFAKLIRFNGKIHSSAMEDGVCVRRWRGEVNTLKK